MQVFLEAIQFNHDPDSATCDAFNIRKNEIEFVPRPEWQRGKSVNPEDSPAAYSILETRGKRITIQAKFKCSDVSVRGLKVRALDANNSGLINRGCNPGALLMPFGLASRVPRNVLGVVREKTISLDVDGESGFEIFELADIQFASVGANTTRWRWQFRLGRSDPWTDFALTSHRIYTVWAPPTNPWQQQPYFESNPHLPWSDVLEHACAWASGAQSTDGAAAMITRNVYDLGLRLVTSAGDPSYAFRQFDCTQFLELLQTGVGRAQTVNCDDCATIVSTFANILGCDLWQSGMGLGFNTNKVLIIGCTKWKRTGFARHAVAWQGECMKDDPLFDAFLLVDGDAKPAVEPHKALLPIKMRFGEWSDRDYSFCLVAKSSVCVPLPETERQRRHLGSGYLGQKPLTNPEYLKFLKDRYAYSDWEFPPQRTLINLNPGPPLENFVHHQAFEGWRLHSINVRSDVRFTKIVEALLQPVEVNPEVFIGVKLFECSPTTNSREFLLEILGAFQTVDFAHPIGLFLGDIAFARAGNTATAFARDRFVSLIRSSGRKNISTLEIGRLVDSFLMTFL